MIAEQPSISPRRQGPGKAIAAILMPGPA